MLTASVWNEFPRRLHRTFSSEVLGALETLSVTLVRGSSVSREEPEQHLPLGCARHAPEFRVVRPIVTERYGPQAVRIGKCVRQEAKVVASVAAQSALGCHLGQARLVAGAPGRWHV